MYQVIARKFRPQKFEDVVGQEHVTRVLSNAIEMDRLPHAFIFSGPRGVGKTSVARILAKALNCEKGLSNNPCNTCSICEDITASRAMDIFEIDAATHTQVEKIRDLIENSRYAPTIARFKTFIIDEAHMLSRNAFNALLKTLEEPPPHVIFILATTELAKVPVTVLSRCQRYDFRRISVDDIVARLKSVAQQENIFITDDALMTIAIQGDGSMRDAQGILEHISATGKTMIDVAAVEDVLGLVGRSTMHDLVLSIMKKDVPSILDVIERVYRYGQDLSQLYRSLLEFFRNMMVLKAGYTQLILPEEEKTYLKDLIKETSLEEIHRYLSVLIRSEEDFKYSSMPRVTLETILLRITSAPRLVDIQQLIQVVSSRPGALLSGHTPQVSSIEMYKRPPSSIPQSWDGFLAFLKDRDQPLYAMVTYASLRQEDGDKVVLSCPNQFLADQVKQASAELAKRAKAFFQKDISIIIEVNEVDLPDNKKQKPSEIRSHALKTPIVREIMAEFDGVVKNVKPKE
jgi:DNA polymerase III subunit gamma/tau